MKVQRVEKHIIKPKHPYYKMLDDFCFKSKNLYNFANYQIRQEYIKNGKYIGFYDIDKLLKQEGLNYDYRAMPLNVCSQQCLRLLDKNYKSFFKAIKDYSKNKNKYRGRPKLPKYLPKDGRNVLIVNYNGCRIKEGVIHFGKTFNGFTLKTNCESLQQVRILPRNRHMVIEVVYNYEANEQLEDNNRYMGIDIGLDNLATVVNNVGLQSFIVNGRTIKSINKYYNKEISHYREVAKRMNNLDYTKKMNSITIKRNNIISTMMHKASKIIVDFAKENDINTIIIGNNKDWKRESKMSKKVNQSFVGIPHQRLIEMIQYKAENLGINVILTEESYTSGTSFLDGELPTKKYYNKTRRVQRGLFISNSNIKINSDVNGAYQIVKKVIPNAFSHGIEGLSFSPIKVDI